MTTESETVAPGMSTHARDNRLLQERHPTADPKNAEELQGPAAPCELHDGGLYIAWRSSGGAASCRPTYSPPADTCIQLRGWTFCRMLVQNFNEGLDNRQLMVWTSDGLEDSMRSMVWVS